MGAAGSGRIVVTDSELIAANMDHVTQCGPGEASDLPRLYNHSKMYERYRFINLRVEYVPMSGMATEGSITITIQPGPKNVKITDAASAMKCQPCLTLPAWKAGSLRANARIDAQRFLHVGASGEDEVSFTIYAFSSLPKAGATIGHVKVSYSVELAFPHPFT